MIVIPFKLLPYFLIVGGIGLITEGSSFWGVCCIIIGIVILYFRHSKKNETHTDNSSANKPIINEISQSNNQPKILKCKKCGAELQEGSVYCVNCGSKI